jgi:hypothetical protein
MTLAIKGTIVMVPYVMGGCGVFLPQSPLPKRVLAAAVIQYSQTYIYVYIL